MATKKLQKQPAPLAKRDERPAYLQRDGAPVRGLEEATQSDLTLPRLAICQSMSPQRKKTSSNFIAGLEEGQFFNTLTGRIYGTELDIIPLFLFKNRMKFKPFDDGGGLECASQNSINGGRLCATCAACTFSMFSPDGSPPECFLMYNYPCLLPDELDELFVLSLRSASTKIAKQLNSFARLRQADMFAGVYHIATKEEAGAGPNPFYNYTIANAGWCSDEQYLRAENVHNTIREARITVDHDDTGEIPA